MKLVNEMPKGCRFVVIGQFKETPCCEMLEDKNGVLYSYNELHDDWTDELEFWYFLDWDNLQYYVAS